MKQPNPMIFSGIRPDSSIRKFDRIDIYSVFVFLYFISLSVDLINVEISYFRLKLSHLFGVLMFFVLFFKKRILFFEKKFFFCFLFILSSMLISSFFSLVFFRSFVYSIVYVFNFFVYFLVPISLIYFNKERKILKYYYLSYLCIGFYAFLQFFASLFGVILPFVIQTIGSNFTGIARGQGLAHEPSFFALYAIPIVSFITAYVLFKSCSHKIKSSEWCVLLLANLFLLATTTTTAMFGYFIFMTSVWIFSYASWIKKWMKGVRKRLFVPFCYFLSAILLGAFIFRDLFSKTFLKFFYLGLFTHISFLDRFEGIVNSLRVFYEHPLFGVGLGGVAPYLYQEQLYQGMSGLILNIDRYVLEKLETTNILTEILASFGLYGLMAFGFLIAVVWTHFTKLLRNPHLLEEERLITLSFFISIVVMIMCLQINMGLFRVYTWVHMGLGVGYVLKIKQRLKTQQQIVNTRRKK